MPGTQTSSELKGTAVVHGRIIDVDAATYTVTVAMEFVKKPQSGISFATPYQHYANGEGIYFMPEVGSTCWVCFPSDGNRAFVLAWSAANANGDFRSLKQDLNPGDIYLGTRDENFLVLRRGGVVQVGATATCQRIFIPVNNMIRDYCQNYGLYAFGGDLEWTVGRPEETVKGDSPALLKLYARENAKDEKPIAELEIGSQAGSSDSILSLTTFDSGGSGRKQKTSFKMDKNGNVSWQIAKDLVYTVTGNIRFSTDGTFTVEAKKDILASGENVTLKASKKVNIEAPEKATITSPTTETSGQLHVGGGATFTAVLYELLKLEFDKHTHPVVVMGAAGETGPAIMGAGSGGGLSSTVSSQVLKTAR